MAPPCSREPLDNESAAALEALLTGWAPLAPLAEEPGLVAHQASDLFGLWQAWESQGGGDPRDPPFWAVVWPAARALVRFLAAEPHWVAGKRVLDLGCGGGIAGIAAARCGARAVIANDIDPWALAVARRNAAAAGVQVAIDPHDYASARALPAVEVVLAADIFYERTPSMGWVRLLRRSDAAVLFADAGRGFAPRTAGRLLARYQLAVDPEVEGVARREVGIYELERVPEVTLAE